MLESSIIALGRRAGSGPSQAGPRYGRILLVLLFPALKTTRGSACGEGSIGVTPPLPSSGASRGSIPYQRWHWWNLTLAAVAHDPLVKLQ